MTIIDHPSPNHSARKAGVRVDTIVLHHTATADGAPAIEWLCGRTSGVSAHYVVLTDGDVLRLVPEDRKAWHAGKGRLPWETCEPYDFNHRSIGIELVNPGDGKTPFTEAQYLALELLVPGIVRRWGRRVEMAGGWFLPDADKAIVGVNTNGLPVFVLGHRDIAPGRKTDPADNFDWARVRHALANTQGVG